MTGLFFALAPFLASIAVARRDPTHRPIRDALGCSAWYSLCVTLAGPGANPRALLCLWGLIATASGWAYLRAFGWRERSTFAALPIGIALAIYLATERGAPERLWPVATWGPFVASSVVGALALWRWWAVERTNKRKLHGFLRREFTRDGTQFSVIDVRLPAVMTIARRTALLLLASDVCILAFIRWPGVQVWQGRAAAVAIAGVQVMWLIERKRT